jgi:site-specific DNA recombinase
VYTAIREMLRRELYIGRIVWNKRRYVKKPGTNKRISVIRPEKDWVIVEEPSLRIVPQGLFEEVQGVLKNKSDQYSTAIGGLMNRAASARYPFSGILNCAECGSNLTIISARGKNRRTGYYGCPGHLHRGICSNNLCERRGLIEEKLLGGIRERLLESLAIDYAAAQIMKGLTAEAGHDQLGILHKKQAQLRLELARLGDAIATSGGSKTLLEVLTKKETELERIQMTASALTQSPSCSRFRLAAQTRGRGNRCSSDAVEHRSGTCEGAHSRNVSEIRMHPTEEDGKKFYVAEGEWLIGEKEKVTGAMLNSDLRMVAGARNATCMLFKIKLC